MPEKYVYFDGIRFTRDDSTGYYLSSRNIKGNARQRIHVYVWEHYNGSVPDGCHIHHIDGNKSNNNIENLELLDGLAHLSLHGSLNAVLHHDKLAERLKKHAIPKAKEWHGSDRGREWHKNHYQKMKDRLYVERDYVCVNCGDGYKSVQTTSKLL